MKQNIALVGIGAIAKQQHVPALLQSEYWQLSATVSRSSQIEGIENYADIEQLLQARPDITTVSLCVPPVPRFDIAKLAIENGKHVMLEKPPGATMSQCILLRDLAKEHGVSLFATWHSREAATLDQAQAWLSDKEILGFSVQWLEDVRQWHPGQEWIWQPGGLGVFDPGINALSILTKILPCKLTLRNARMLVPSNRQTPIAASLTLLSGSGAEGKVDFDFRQQGKQIWDINIDTPQGSVQLRDGGASLVIETREAHHEQVKSQPARLTLNEEYPRLYNKMHQLVSTHTSECDLSPQVLVSDAFMLAHRALTDPFEF